MFKAGQKVVFKGYIQHLGIEADCVNTKNPIKGNIYTVNHTSINDNDYGYQYIGLEEMEQDDEFLSLCFEPLNETFATEVLEQIKEQIEQEELVTI